MPSVVRRAKTSRSGSAPPARSSSGSRGPRPRIAQQLEVSECAAYYNVQDELGRLNAVTTQRAERLRELELRRCDRPAAGARPRGVDRRPALGDGGDPRDGPARQAARGRMRRRPRISPVPLAARCRWWSSISNCPTDAHAARDPRPPDNPERLADITEAARTIGTLLQTANGRVR